MYTHYFLGNISVLGLLRLEPDLFRIDEEIGLFILVEGHIKAFFTDEAECLQRLLMNRTYLFGVVWDNFIALDLGASWINQSALLLTLTPSSCTPSTLASLLHVPRTTSPNPAVLGSICEI